MFLLEFGGICGSTIYIDRLEHFEMFFSVKLKSSSQFLEQSNIIIQQTPQFEQLNTAVWCLQHSR